MPRPTLVCAAHPFGYGPAAKLLHIARRLRDRDLRLAFVGVGIAHELAARSDLFDEIVHAEPADARVRQLIGSAGGLLSLMERDYAAIAVELGRPIFVADSLLWMRAQVPAVFRQARRFWAQDFVGVRERLADVGPFATLVGPIVAPSVPSPPCANGPIVVNLGGSETPDRRLSDDPAYLDFVIGGLRDRRLPIDVVLAGERCIRSLQARHADCRMKMMSARHDDALEMLRQARLVVTAPGLTATLECFQIGVPTLFLPPQNYSQWWILQKLRDRGLAPLSFHWADVQSEYPITERMPEDGRGAIVGDAIGRSATLDARQTFTRDLVQSAGADLDDLARRQRAFFISLGTDGTDQIADELVRFITVDKLDGDSAASATPAPPR